MTWRTFLASCIRTAARRIDEIEAPDSASAASFRASALKVRAAADRLDPPTMTCVVCGEHLSVSSSKTHACPPGALAAWHARVLDSVDTEGPAS